MEETFEVQAQVRPPWRQFIDDIAPLRPELFRYCRGLTGSVWDAEDLVQDTLAKVFAALGKQDGVLSHPRTYLVRAATHLWFDRLRRLRLERRHDEIVSEVDEAAVDPSQAADVRAAVASLFTALPPQERAALLLKDVLDFTLEETAGMLRTTEGAVKSALHRARAKLAARAAATDLGAPPANAPPVHAPPVHAPPRAIVDRFMTALAAKDFDGIRDLCLADVTIEHVGGAQQETFERGKITFQAGHFVMPAAGFGENPRWEMADYEGEPVVVGYRTLGGVEGVNEVWRLEVEDGAITRARLYAFTPDLLAAVAEDLGRKALRRPYRSPSRG